MGGSRAPRAWNCAGHLPRRRPRDGRDACVPGCPGERGQGPRGLATRPDQGQARLFTPPVGSRARDSGRVALGPAAAPRPPSWDPPLVSLPSAFWSGGGGVSPQMPLPQAGCPRGREELGPPGLLGSSPAHGPHPAGRPPPPARGSRSEPGGRGARCWLKNNNNNGSDESQKPCSSCWFPGTVLRHNGSGR